MKSPVSLLIVFSLFLASCNTNSVESTVIDDSKKDAYTVTWKNYDGTVFETDTNVEYGTMPSYDGPIPTRESSEGKEYIFEGWSPEVSKVTGDLTYIATFSSSAIKYTIRFDIDGGYSPSYVASKEVTGFSTDDLFYDCTKSGYHFRGWSYNNEKVVDENGNQLKEFQLAKNMTFRAIFAQTAKLTIVINDGFEDAPSSISETAEYPYNTNVDIYAHPKQGYVFVGWYYNEYPLNNDEEYHYMMWSDDVTIEARFKYDTYTMSIHSYQPSIGQVLISPLQIYQDNYEKDFDYKSNVTIAAYTATPIRFLGWFDNDNKLVTTDAVYSFMMPNHDYELTAKWNKFTINYNLDGGTNDSRNPSEYAVEDSVQLYDAIKEGYTFLGWKLNGEYIDSIDGELKTNITLDAIYSTNEYRTYYHLNGGVNNPSNPETYNYEDDAINLADPSRNGYTFIGWYKESTFENQVTSISYHSVGNVELYAKWDLNIHSITYNLDWGVNNPLNPETYTYEDDAINLVDPSRKGYTFVGWYKESTFINQVTSISHNSVGNIELYAKWNLNIYSITYYLDGGVNNPSNPETYNYEDDVINLANPSREGYTFAGWYKESAFINQVTSISHNSVGNINLYAKWTPDNYSITYYLDGGVNNPSNPETYNYEDDVINLANPSREGYTFAGWYKESAFINQVTSISYHSVGNVEIYAKWNPLEELSAFQYSSHNGEITIEGLKDNTTSSITIPSIIEFQGEVFVVTSIGDNAFESCSNLTSITVPNSVISIADNAFDGCSSSLNINYKGTLENWLAVQGKNNLKGRVHLYFNGSETEATSIVVPDYITSIGFCAFKNCSSLTTISIQKGVTSIGNYAFEGCSNLTSITIPDGVTSIGRYAFYNCSNLTSITIPNSVTSIDKGAFSGCSSLVSITLPFVGSSKTATTASSSTLFGYIFGTSSYEGGTSTKQYYGSSVTYYIPTSLRNVAITGGNILYGAFYNCSNLTSITLPNSVTSIRNYAFYNCSNLTSITIPNSVTSIGEGAFSGCSNLTSITIPDGVTSFGNYAFEGCSNLTSITIPNSVTFIGSEAFSGCSAKIIWRDNPTITKIGNSAFYGYRGTSISIPNSVTSIGNNAFESCSNLTSITIPDSVTSIGSGAFSGCSSLVSITLPFVGSSKTAAIASSSTLFGYIFGENYYTGGTKTEQRYSIGGSLSYRYCIPTSLRNVTITGGNILYGAFYNCSKLSSITIPNSVTSIGNCAFEGCSNLTSITLSNNVTSIGDYAFCNCSNLSSITIPISVTSIGEERAFYNCSNLKKIYYIGSTQDWSSINGSNALINVTKYYYSEAEPAEAGNYWHYVDGVPTIW